MPNKEYMDAFFTYLNQLYSYNKERNSEFIIDTDMVYTLLINYGVMETEKNIRPLFNIWDDRFKTRPGIDVFASKEHYFCYFGSGMFNVQKAIKLYVPLKSHNLDRNITRIFEYMRANNIAHSSKVSEEIRNDDLVIRTPKENVQKIIDFITNDDEIKKDLGFLNPLTANFNGIGVTRDGDESYNYFLSQILAGCLNKGMVLNANSYSNYLKQISARMPECDEKMICEIASKVKSGITINEISDYDIKPEKSSKPLLEAMEATRKKYGIEQVYSAIYKYITRNNALGFTRGEGKFDYRYNLESKLTSEDVAKIIDAKVSKNISLPDKIEMFVNSIYADEISMAKEEQYKTSEDFLSFLVELYLNNNCDRQKVVNIINKMIKNNEEFRNVPVSTILKKVLVQIYPSYKPEQINENLESKAMINTIVNLIEFNLEKKDKKLKV